MYLIRPGLCPAFQSFPGHQSRQFLASHSECRGGCIHSCLGVTPGLGGNLCGRSPFVPGAKGFEEFSGSRREGYDWSSKLTMRLCFWWNILSPHQSAYVRELAKAHDVVVVAAQRMSDDRARLGWGVPDFGRANALVAPERERALNLLGGGEDTVHLLEGWRGCGLSAFVLRNIPSTARVGVISEAGDARGLAGLLRAVRCRTDVRRNRRVVDLVLAMGVLGEAWFQRCGVPESKVFPFGYTVEQPDRPECQEPRDQLQLPFGVLYLGQFIECKGVDRLLAALAGCARLSWRAELVGNGPLKARCFATTEALGLSDRIHFLPAQEHSAAMKRLAQADLLVLPSLYDGWGAVVNEALMRGVPVICTSACGASDLIRYPWLGSVVAPGSVEGLRRALTESITRGPRTAARSDKIRAWSRCIGGESVASYFLSVLGHVYQGGPRPVVPWRIEARAEAVREGNPGITCARDRFGTDSFPPGFAE